MLTHAAGATGGGSSGGGKTKKKHGRDSLASGRRQ